jgi:hypothetical protein
VAEWRETDEIYDLEEQIAMADKQHAPVLRAGWWIAVTVTRGVFPLTSYVGRIEAVAPEGVRLMLAEQAIGAPTGQARHQNISTAVDLIRDLRRRGIRLAISNESLATDVLEGVLRMDELEQIHACKSDLLAVLRAEEAAEEEISAMLQN